MFNSARVFFIGKSKELLDSSSLSWRENDDSEEEDLEEENESNIFLFIIFDSVFTIYFCYNYTSSILIGVYSLLFLGSLFYSCNCLNSLIISFYSGMSFYFLDSLLLDNYFYKLFDSSSLSENDTSEVELESDILLFTLSIDSFMFPIYYRLNSISSILIDFYSWVLLGSLSYYCNCLNSLINIFNYGLSFFAEDSLLLVFYFYNGINVTYFFSLQFYTSSLNSKSELFNLRVDLSLLLLFLSYYY